MKLFLTFLMTAVTSIFASQMMASRANATTDSIARFNFVYVGNIQEEPIYDYQTYLSDLAAGYNTLDGYCIGEGIFWDGVSSSAYPMFDFMTKPFNIQSYGFIDDEQININLLSNPNLKIIFDFDSVSNYVELQNNQFIYAPSFTVDISAFPKTNDTEIFMSLVNAKLAILGIFANLERAYPDAFKAEIKVVGLPDQTKYLSKDFSNVYATTAYNYSSASPIIEGYQKELLSQYCK